MLLDDALAHHARFRPHAPALIFRGHPTSYRVLEQRVNRCANALIGLGVAKGDRVAILTQNHPVFAETLAACARIGAVLVPLNYRLSMAEISVILQASAPQCVFVQDAFLGPLRDHDRALTPAGRTFVFDASNDEGAGSYEALLAAAKDTRPEVRRTPQDHVLLQYTSGTTGTPKGILSTHAGWIRASLIEPPLKGIGADSVFLNVMPMCHTGGAKWVVEVMFAGAAMTVGENANVDEMLDQIARHRVTNTSIVPTTLYHLLDAPRRRTKDISSLRYINYGGAPMSEQRLAQALEELGCNFTQGYGMTELAGGSVTYAGPADHWANGAVSPKLRSAGRPLIDCEVRLLSEDGALAGAGDTGEIAVRTDRLFTGYFGANAPAPPFDADGFFRTGDIGRFDDDGYLYVVDRAKDMIVSGGLNIYSKEVEDALLAHPAVSEAYVVGAPDEEWGESVKAIIVQRQNANMSAEDAIAWCREQLASYKKPRIVEFVRSEELPRTSLGKVVKRDLRASDWRKR